VGVILLWVGVFVCSHTHGNHKIQSLWPSAACSGACCQAPRARAARTVDGGAGARSAQPRDTVRGLLGKGA
jgi:hypothetical protein